MRVCNAAVNFRFIPQKFNEDGTVKSSIDKFFNENERWKPEYRPVSWVNEKELLGDPEFAKALKDCFDKLPQQWSFAVQLKFLEEHDSKAICSKLEITTSNFWQILILIAAFLRLIRIYIKKAIKV